MKLEVLNQINSCNAKHAPLSMCQAFGSLRVMMRVDGVVPILVGNAGCVYGLDFVSHFYGARKSVLTPVYTSADLTNGRIEDRTREAVRETIARFNPRVIALITLCNEETVSLSVDAIAKEYDAQAAADPEFPLIVPMHVPGYGVKSHAEAKDIAASQLLKRLAEREGLPARTTDAASTIGEVFPADPLYLEQILARMGVKLVAHIPSRTIGDFRKVLSVGVNITLHPFYVKTCATLAKFKIPSMGCTPVGVEGTRTWIERVGKAFGVKPALADQIADIEAGAVERIFQKNPVRGTVIVAGYEGSELMVARLLIEAGADVPYVSTNIGASPFTKEDEEWLAKRGTTVIFRKTYDQDVIAVDNLKPDLVLGTTALAAHAKSLGIPGMYFTNIFASRPLFLAQGAETITELVNNAIGRRDSYARIKEFFTDADAFETSEDEQLAYL
jgi:chlorophyllide a reductase subunit Y